MNNPIPQCGTDSPEWAFRAVEMINRLVALRDALIWWIECSDGAQYWGYWLKESAMFELVATSYAAWAEVLRTLEETK